MTLHLAAWIAAIGGTFLTLWLLWSLWSEAKRQQTPRYQSHSWLVDQERDALNAYVSTRMWESRVQRELIDAGYRGLVSDAKRKDCE